MTQKDVIRKFEELGVVIINSHIVYTSGKHGSAYVNKDVIYSDTQLTKDFCLLIADNFNNDGIEVVVGHATGGAILAQYMAQHLTAITGRKIYAAYADKEEFSKEEKFIIRRGYNKLVYKKRVLIVEDVLNTGGSVKKVIDAVRFINGNVIGVGALCNRGNVTSEQIGNPPKFFSLTNISLEAFKEEDCPLCAKKIPINTDIGKGREYLARIGKN